MTFINEYSKFKNDIHFCVSITVFEISAAENYVQHVLLEFHVNCSKISPKFHVEFYVYFNVEFYVDIFTWGEWRVRPQ